MFSWDYGYYHGIVKIRKHNIDNEEIREYFPVKEVIHKILDMCQNMLSLKFVKIDNPPVWHPDVEMYEVWEANENTSIGHFYLDLYPREGKFNHAGVFQIRPHFDKPDGTHEYPVSVMMANFPKPASSKPALLTHGNVITFLHEMGHLFHDICSMTKYKLFHGIQTKKDFAEAPSQMLENWGWETSCLRQLTCHYITGKPIPKKLVKKLIATKKEGAGVANLEQIFFGIFDTSIHDTKDGKVNIKGSYRILYECIMRLICGSNEACGAATLIHTMIGYDDAYYGYMWSKMFSADMYATRFKKEGVTNPKTGMDYRNQILRPGSSRDAMESLEAFLGRKPNNKAFLKSIGLKTHFGLIKKFVV